MKVRPTAVSSLNERYIRAGCPTTTVEELWSLASDDVDNVRRRVAENPRCPQELLTELAIDENPDVRIAVAENPNTIELVKEQLARDESVDVRYSLAENPNLPISILDLLAEDENAYVAHRARRTIRLLQPADMAELKPRAGGQNYMTRDIKFRP